MKKYVWEIYRKYGVEKCFKKFNKSTLYNNLRMEINIFLYKKSIKSIIFIYKLQKMYEISYMNVCFREIFNIIIIIHK